MLRIIQDGRAGHNGERIALGAFEEKELELLNVRIGEAEKKRDIGFFKRSYLR